MACASSAETQYRDPNDLIDDGRTDILPPSGEFGLTVLDEPEPDITPTVLARWTVAQHHALEGSRSPENIRDIGDVIKEGTKILGEMVIHGEPVPIHLVWGIAKLSVIRFDSLRQLGDLETAMECFKKLLDMVPKDYTGRSDLLRSLAGSFEKLFEITQELGDLDNAVKYYSSAGSSTGTIIQKVKSLFAEGRVLSHRSFLTRSRGDMDDAVRLLRESVRLGRNLDGILRPGTLLTTLGIRLRDRYYMSRSKPDICEALMMCQEAKDTIPPGRFHRPILRNLARTHLTMYTATKEWDHLELAVQLFKDIITNTPQEDDNWPQAVLDVSTSLWYLYSSSDAKRLDHLDLAIQWAQILVEDSPQDMDALYILGQMLAARSPQRGPKEGKLDYEQAITVLRSVLRCQVADPEMRLASGRMLSRMFYDNAVYQDAWETVEEILLHLPILSTTSLNNNDKQWLYSEYYVSGLASEAAGIALAATDNPVNALNCLERGSRHLLASFDTIFAEVSELKQLYPELSSKFMELQSELRRGTIYPARSHQVSRELESLCDKIRKTPGFEQFLLPPTEQQLCDAAIHGPIVILNSLPDRSDAILIQRDQIRPLRLPNLRHEDVVKKTSDGDLASTDTLEWLWRHICEPVLNALSLTDSPVEGDLPHVWWVPVGELSRFALHAAGLYREGGKNTVLDRAMSSYALLPSAILRARKLPSFVPVGGRSQALLVAMPHTPGKPDLPNAKIEIDTVRDICEASNCHVLVPAHSKGEVLTTLATSHIFHFAGHGTTHATDPSQSSLLLQDWLSDCLTVGDLLKQELRAHAPFLACLSACGTGRIQEGRYLDESIHLMSSLQLAGFRHVIGTLWSVEDKSCAEMAKILYKIIFGHGLSDGSVCEGLHEATRILRQKWLNAVNTTRSGGVFWDMYDASEVTAVGPQLNWAAYVHFGC